jgi:hypothetical protein
MMKVGGIPTGIKFSINLSKFTLNFKFFTEESYGPYLGQDGYCHVNNATLVASITGFVNVTSGK